MCAPRKLLWLALANFGWLGLCVFWWLTYTGPERWLGKWQVQLFGSYQQGLGLLILQVPTIVVNLLVARLLGYCDFNPVTVVSDCFRTYPILQDSLFSLVLLAIAAGLVVLVLQAAPAPDLGVVLVADIESGKVAESRFRAELAGFLGPPLRVEERRYGSVSNVAIYYPFRSKLDDTGIVYLILAVNERNLDKTIKHDLGTGKAIVRGLVNKSFVLAPDVGSWFEERGLTLAPDWRFIGTDEGPIDPNEKWRTFWTIEAILVSMAVMGFALKRWQRFRQYVLSSDRYND